MAHVYSPIGGKVAELCHLAQIMRICTASFRSMKPHRNPFSFKENSCVTLPSLFLSTLAPCIWTGAHRPVMQARLAPRVDPLPRLCIVMRIPLACTPTQILGEAGLF